MKPTRFALVFGCGALVACVGLHAAPGGETVKSVTSTAGDRDEVAVTVYNDNLALIKEQRRLSLSGGTTRLDLRDVAAALQPETALLRAVDGAPIRLLEQNFDFDLLSPANLLKKAVGHEVTVVRPPAQGIPEKRERATVLADNEGAVLRFADRVEANPPGYIEFDGVPPELRDKPTLSVLVDGEGGKRRFELSYLSSGMSWSADYVANLAKSTLDLDGWITVTNSSGANFENATVQFVAGAVRTAPRAMPLADRNAYLETKVPAAAAPREEALLDFHLYTFDRRTTIANNQTKQLALLSASGVPCHREYVLQGFEWGYRTQTGGDLPKIKPEVFLVFENKGGSMGKPLPAGIVRVYAQDTKGAAQFVGEDRIEHTARNETVRVNIGQAFDITAERTQTAFHRVAKNVIETSWRIDIRNAKDEPVTISVREPISGDWEIFQESDAHTKQSAREARWSIDIPAGGAKTLTYSVRITS